MRKSVWHVLGWLISGLVVVYCSRGGNSGEGGPTGGEEMAVIDAITPHAIDLSTKEGLNPNDLAVTFTNPGPCALDFNISAKTADGTSWLSVTPVRGTLLSEPQTLTVSIDVKTPALKGGIYAGVLTLGGQCQTNGRPAHTKTVPVNLRILLPPPPPVVLHDSWLAPMTTANAPSARQNHAAVWTGSKMLIWGGNDTARQATTSGVTAGQATTTGRVTATGGVYDPADDRWTAMATNEAPVPRENHTVMGTHAAMIIWGGEDGNTLDVLATGGIYNPENDRWTPTATDGAPAPRYNHTAVWTGSKMLIWGGEDDDNPFNTGGIYDPKSNHWSAISGGNAPSARTGHTAVWTGSKMLIWGGADIDSEATTTGGVYDPLNDRWNPISTVNAPSARQGHTALWTGSKMLIWGGEGGGATGGVYDPERDDWKTISTINAPSPREGYTAVWTGSQMLIWGGGNTAGVLQATGGGAYDPASDSWTAMPESGAPSARQHHTAVWTGSKMLIWGGDGGQVPLQNGGIYGQ